MTQEQRGDDPATEVGVEQGGGPPAGMPWTLIAPDEQWEADLEHPAPLPRVGERIEFIAEDGTRRRYVVREIVHTLQPSASQRPAVALEQTSPNSIVTDREHPPPRELRAGLPRVIVSVED